MRVLAAKWHKLLGVKTLFPNSHPPLRSSKLAQSTAPSCKPEAELCRGLGHSPHSFPNSRCRSLPGRRPTLWPLPTLKTSSVLSGSNLLSFQTSFRRAPLPSHPWEQATLQLLQRTVKKTSAPWPNRAEHRLSSLHQQHLLSASSMQDCEDKRDKISGLKQGISWVGHRDKS